MNPFLIIWLQNKSKWTRCNRESLTFRLNDIESISKFNVFALFTLPRGQFDTEQLCNKSWKSFFFFFIHSLPDFDKKLKFLLMCLSYSARNTYQKAFHQRWLMIFHRNDDDKRRRLNSIQFKCEKLFPFSYVHFTIITMLAVWAHEWDSESHQI